MNNPHYAHEASTPGARSRSALALPLGMLALLGVEFLLGMAVNLFVTLSPLPGPSGSMMSGNSFMMGSFMHDGPLVALHAMLGLALAAGALANLGFARRYGSAAARSAAAGLAGVVVAALGGAWFLTQGQSNGASLVMAIGFIAAVGSYVAQVIVSR